MKNYLVAKRLTEMACAVILLAGFGQANAQTSSDLPSAGGTMDAGTAARPLPTISNGSAESRRQLQQSQIQQQRILQQERAQYNRDARPPKEIRNVFGDYVNGVSGVPLELFGKNLFTDVPSTFAPFDAAQVNGDYVIGAGDELQIRGWGMIDVDVTVTVDRAGAIYVPRVGAVKVAGVKYRDLQGYLKQAVSKNFKNFELTASISQTRSLQIYVVGHAVRPGTYNISSMSTLLNALFTSGGPDATGSMRNIQLKRGAETVITFDLYDMLVRGDKSNDATLRDGDVVYIPESGPLVALSGNVKSPAIFELKGPTSLQDVIGWAGGVDASADRKNIVVEKAVNGVYRPVAEMVADAAAMRPALSAIPVQSADVIRVFSPGAVPLPALQSREFVRVSGEVSNGGVIELRKGETLRELMFRLGGSNDRGYLYAMQVTRESVRRNQQLKLDEVADRFEREIDSVAAARLAVTSDKDAQTNQAAEVERQRAVAKKLRSVKAEGRIVLELAGAGAQVKNLPDLPLENGDSIYVPRKPDTVEVLGSVFQSNSFIFKPNRSVNDYVRLAGGTTKSADDGEMYLLHADGTAVSAHSRGWFSGVGGQQINPGDTIVVPENIERSNWRQSLKEWTAIFYQFGLGAAGLKVLKN